MKTYKDHYLKCRQVYNGQANIYDLTYKVNCVEYDNENFNQMVKTINQRLDYKLGCVEEIWSTYLNNLKDIKQLSVFLNEVVPQIEENIAGCFLKAEHVHIYENKKNVSLESSWAWHYDDCPAEFIKFAIYLNAADESNGAMQIIPEVIESFRTSPQAINRPPPVFAKSRVPMEYISEKTPITLSGDTGTNFVFTPNMIHRGTVPKARSTNRKALFVFLRPSLKKYDNYLLNASTYLPKRDVKIYKLD